MNIFWFSNVDIASQTMDGSGTWVFAMASALCEHYPDIHITNVSISDIDGDKIACQGKIRQVKIKSSHSRTEIKKLVTELIEVNKPNLLHVWGTEADWATFVFPAGIPVLIDMQGIVSSVYENFYGGLSNSVIRGCITLKEILKPNSSLQRVRSLYKKNIEREQKLLSTLSFVSVQSNWVEGYIRAFNKKCKIYHTGIILRKEFYTASSWIKPNKHVIFSTATMVTPLKGLHTLIEALAIVKRYFPDVEVRLAGSVQTGIRIGGYAKYIFQLIKKYNLGNNIKFLGSLNTEKLIKEYQSASVVVNSSSIESYSLVTAESMYLGTPVVASSVGGMAELGEDNKSILYFPKEDYVTCAHKTLSILMEKIDIENLSKAALELAHERNDESRLVDVQYNIYQSILRGKD